MSVTTVNLGNAKRQAIRYARQGYNPLPSMEGRKRPAMSAFKKERDEGISDKQLESWWAPNIQIATGCRWRLAVVDVDGELGLAQWQEWCQRWGCPVTWEVESGSGNRHYWFTTPASLTSLKTTLLWQGPGRKQLIELIADKGLIVAPPSSYGDGREYRFVHSQTLTEPALLPRWVIRLSTPIRPPIVPLPHRPRITMRRGQRLDRATVLATLSPDQKLILVRQWGLRIVDEQPDREGWVTCRAYDREDRHPSARLNLNTGHYYDFATKQWMTLCDLGVALGQFAHWQDTLSYCGELTHAS